MNRASDKKGAIINANVNSRFRVVIAWVVAAAVNDVLCPLPPPLLTCVAGDAVPVAAALARAFQLQVVLGVGVAGVDVGAAAVGEVSVAVRFVVAGIGAAVAIIALVARSSRSLTVTQLGMSISLGIEMIVATTARL